MRIGAMLMATTTTAMAMAMATTMAVEMMRCNSESELTHPHLRQPALTLMRS